MPRVVRVVDAAAPPEPDEDTGCAGAHEVQGGGVGGRSSDDDGDVEVVDELLQVQRFGDAGDVLGGHRGAADDEQVDAGCCDGVVELLGALRGEGAGDRDTAVADLGEARGDEFGLDRLGVQVLHPHRRLLGRQRGDLGEQGLGVLVARPQPLEVEGAEAAELAEHDRRGRAHDRVHRRADHRGVEREGVDRPHRRDVFGIAGASRWHDGDVVERVCATRALGPTEFDVHAHPSSLPAGRALLLLVEADRLVALGGAGAALRRLLLAVLRRRGGHESVEKLTGRLRDLCDRSVEDRRIALDGAFDPEILRTNCRAAS